MLESTTDPELVRGFLARHGRAEGYDIDTAARLVVEVLPDDDVRAIAGGDSRLARAVAVQRLRRLARDGRFEAACRGALSLIDSLRLGAAGAVPSRDEVDVIQKARRQLASGELDPATRGELLRLADGPGVSRGVLALAGRTLLLEGDPRAAWVYFEMYLRELP
jgi:hypothetical protein